MKLLPALLWEPHEADRRLLRRLLREEGWAVQEICARADIAGLMGAQNWVLVFCCVAGETGAALITQLRRLGAATHIIALGPPDGSLTAIESFLQGASDYLTKPLRANEVRRHLRAVREQYHASTHESFTTNGLIYPRRESPSAGPAIIGQAAPLLQIHKQLAQAIAADAHPAADVSLRPASFFLTGETGTGKDLFAQLIHQRSRFGNGPFVVVNCATLPADLAEAELFGHESGAFTGAQRARPGLWEQADGGTLLLDEITEAPPALLPKLLRVLQDGQVKRLGGARWRQTRVQVIAASNRDLPKEIAAGTFRRDLYQRFLHHLHLPPLRERREDIPLLIRHFVQMYATHPAQFSLEALTLLQEHDWPGNARELEHLLRAVLTQTGEGRITATLLRSLWREKEKETVVSVLPGNLTATAPLGEQVNDFKRRTARETLIRCRGNITKAAQALGLTRPTLYRWLDDL